MVTFLGLLGAALGAGWLALDERLGLSPGGFTGGVLTLVAATLAVVGVLLVMGGLAYYVLAPAFAAPPAAWRGVGSHRLVIATTVLIALLANVASVAYVAVAGPEGLRTLPGLLTAALSVDAAMLGVTYLRFIRPGVMTVADLGLDRSRLPYLVGIGLLLGIGVLLMSATIQSILQAVGFKQTQMVSLQYIRDFPLLGFLGVVLTGGIVAPIAEELYFRGYVFRTYLVPRVPPTRRHVGENVVLYHLTRLVRARGPVVAYSCTSVLFAILHLNLPALLPILVLSLLLCLAYRRTGSIIPSIVGHSVNNTVAFCILYFTNAPL
jgi:membrane protease YdiL (CAAX protease family)